MKINKISICLVTILLVGIRAHAATDDFSKISKSVQSFQVEPFLGASSTSIPIVVPPGRRGMQPEININYSSAINNGWLGVGWSLNFGYIERQTNKGIPAYDANDVFCVSFMGINSELQTADNMPGEYYPKTTSAVIKFLFKGSYWEAYDKEGRKYVFGQTADSRIDTPKGTFRWTLNKIIDTCGNDINITYAKDNGQIYPLKIEYAGNAAAGAAPTHKVEFVLEDRQDAVYSFRSGYRVATAKRLKEIKTYVGVNLANRYLFEYAYSKQTGRLLLTKFTCFGSDGQTGLAPMAFDYQDANPPEYNIAYIEPKTGNKLWCIRKNFGRWSPDYTGMLYPNGNHFEGGGLVLWGFMESLVSNGDFWSIDPKGKLAVNLPEKTAFHAWTYVYADAAKTISIPFSGAGNFYFWLNGEYSVPVDPAQIKLKEGVNLIEITGYNAAGALSFNLNYALSDNVVRMHSHQFAIPQLSADFNGDGLMDLATYYASSGQIKVSISNGTAFLPSEIWPILPGDGFPKYMGGEDLSLLLGSFNDNNLTDIRVINENTECELITASSSKKFIDQGGGGPKRFPVRGNAFAADFNGDGITDVGLQAKDSGDILIALCSYPYNMGKPAYWLYNFSGNILIGDFNGDGLIDIASYNSAQANISVAMNTGSAFETPQVWLNGFNPGSAPTAADCNGDGLTDICYYDKAKGIIYVAVSNGKCFLAPAQFISGFTLNDPDVALQASDFNGDGASDLYIFNPFTQKTEIAYSKAGFIDLLLTAKNGMGGETSIAYAVSASYDNTISAELKKNYEYKNLKGPGMPFSLPVVKEMALSDGMGNRYSSTYSYKGGFYERGDREFRGFGLVCITDAEGNQKTVYFKQDDIYKGKPYLEEYRDKQGKLYLAVQKEWYSEPISTHPGKSQLYVGSFVHPDSEKKLSYATDNSYKTSYKKYDYTFDSNDQFVVGDLKQIREGGDAATEVSRYIEYAMADGENILSRPAFDYQMKSGYMLSKKWLYYDNNSDVKARPAKGLLTKEKMSVASWDCGINEDLEPANAIITTYAYDTYGNLISATDGENHITTTAYDPIYHIYPVEIKNALGHITKNTYDSKTGKVLTSVDANGQTTTYIYDALGRLSKVIGPLDTAQYPGIIYEYDLSTCPTKVIKKYKTAYPDVYALEYSFYDGLGRPVETKVQAEDAAGSQPRQVVKDAVTYNQQGKAKEKYSPYFVVSSSAYSKPSGSEPKTTLDYDCLGRVTKLTNPDLSKSIIEYSAWTQVKTDENGHQNRSTFDALDRLVKKEEFNAGATYATQYAYDVIEYESAVHSRKIFSITDNNKNITKLYYDLAGRKVKMTDPDMGTWAYTYDRAGNLKTQKDALNQTVSFTYDVLNRLVKKAYPNSKFITYSYDDPAKSYSKGRLSYVVDLSGRRDHYYDQLGRETKVSRAIDGSTYAIERAYNAAGQVVSLKYPDGETVNYIYNKAGAIDKIAGASTYIGNVDYTPSGQIAKVVYGNSAVTDYTYDPKTARLSDLLTNNGALQNLHYQYDPSGNIKHITDSRNSATQDFIYDDLNRLTQANGAYGNFAYQYDPIGNIIYKEGANYIYGSTQPHALTSGSDGFRANYDANGNMVKRANAVLTYDYDNHLTKIEPAPANDPVTVEMVLSPGWNFVAVPLVVGDKNITSVLSSISGKYDQVSRYNPAAAKYEHFINNSTYNQFTTMEPGRGYQVYVTSACTLKLTGTLLTAKYNISLVKGWQMIGCIYKARAKVSDALNNLIKGINYDKISRYDFVKGAFVDLAAADYLEPGQAYFIRLLKNSTWTALPVTEAVVPKTEFVYDTEGNRVKKTTGVVATLYIGEFFEKTGSSATKHIFLGAARVASLILRASAAQGSASREEIAYYHPDHLGSSNIITDKSGKQAQLSEYTPFGAVSVQNPAKALTNYLFTGKELDSTGLYYYGARYYDSKIGRFISADPIEYSDMGIKAAGGKDLATFLRNPQNFNRYSYCRNNPMGYIDPTGMLTIDISGTGTGYNPPSEDYTKALKNTFNEKYTIIGISWSHWWASPNTFISRMNAASVLASYINNYNFAPGESLNVVGFSHGGNVGLILSQFKLKHKIDNMVLLGTPIREYKPNMSNIGKIYNVYSNYDWVQTHGGGDAISLRESGRILDGASNINVNVDKGSYGSHFYLASKTAWENYVDPVIDQSD